MTVKGMEAQVFHPVVVEKRGLSLESHLASLTRCNHTIKLGPGMSLRMTECNDRVSSPWALALSPATQKALPV